MTRGPGRQSSARPWLARPPRPSARVRLFCFPHSGGGASLFAGWPDELPGWVDVLPVLLPGRGERADEPVLESLTELADAVLDGLLPHLDAPFALFGHSMGALLAYELTVRLARAAGPLPAALLVAAMSPPHRMPPSRMHELPDDELLTEINQLGGTPDQVREDDDLMRSVLPTLRADTRAVGTYRHRPGPPVDCPVVLFRGTDDPLMPPASMSAWGELTVRPPAVRDLSGAHFFVRTHRRELTRMITAELRRNLPRPGNAVTIVPSERAAGKGEIARERDGREPVAVVGIGCRFPGAAGPADFWRLLVDGVDAVTEVPADRTDHPEALVVPGPAAAECPPTRHGGFLDDVTGFDAAFFGISPREAERMDPQQRLLLEVTWEALEDAQIPPRSLAGSRTGVFVGQMGRDYWELQSRQTTADLHSLTGSGMASFLSGRVSFALDLRGPSISLDTACSSSLTAVHLACQSLRYGDSDLALAGGANLVLLPELAGVYEQVGLMSRRGRCRFGDASADGFVRSDGVGVVVLKPLARAVADGDRVYAVIMGSASNNDGSGSGSLVAPAQDAQERLLRDAMASAGVSSADVDYVEAHGTGTSTGDAVELSALAGVFGDRRPEDRPCLVGSVKANIGHSEGAAGIAGFIKTVLSLHHRLIPANPLLAEPHPVLTETDTPLRVPVEPLPWPEGPRPIAGVTSFGLSGTNVHVVLTAGAATTSPVPCEEPWPLVLPVSARDQEALGALAADYADRLAGADRITAARVCAAAARGRTHHQRRMAVTAADGDGVAAALRDRLAAESAGSVTPSGGDDPRLAFVFPGHGGQWAGMGRELCTVSPAFRAAIEECAAAIEAAAGWSLLDVLASDDPEALDRTPVIQPALWAMEVALVAHWRSWGIRPDVVVGHSFGEVAAAHVAGALDLAAAARLICRRGELTSEADGKGAMVVVAMAESAAAELAGRYEGRITVAAVNGPRSTVLSGDIDAVTELAAELDAAGVRSGRVRINYASHSHHMDPLCPRLRAGLAGLRPRPADVPFRSTVTGERMSGPDLGADYWAGHLRRPVRFADSIVAEGAAGRTVFLEISPHTVLLPAIRQSLADADQVGCAAVAGGHRDRPEPAGLAAALADLYTAGVDIDWTTYYAPAGAVDELPGYRWRRRHTWFTPREPRRPGMSPSAEVVPEMTQAIRVDIRRDGTGWSCVVSGDGVGAGIQIGPPAATPPAATPADDGHPAAGPPSSSSQGSGGNSDGNAVLAGLAEELGTVLGLPADRIPRGQPLRNVGCDSLMATEIRDQLEQRWGVRLPAGTLLGATAEEIAAKLVQK